MIKELHIVVSGRVQLVMYRDFAQRKARKVGLVGTVENMNDGTVEIYVQGEENDLKLLIQELRNGPVLSRVDDVTIETINKIGSYKGFSIIY